LSDIGLYVLQGSSEYQYIPQEKIEEFGVHANAYYSLDVSIFKSSSDEALLSLLWNKYWANTLSSSPLISVRRHYFRHSIHLDSSSSL
jgi:COP9 signalosome complex subunit 5